MERDYIVSTAIVYNSITNKAFYSNRLSLKCNKFIRYYKMKDENLTINKLLNIFIFYDKTPNTGCFPPILQNQKL